MITRFLLIFNWRRLQRVIAAPLTICGHCSCILAAPRGGRVHGDNNCSQRRRDKAEAEAQAGTEAADTIEKTLEHLFTKQNQKQIVLVVHPYLYSYFTIGVLSRQYKWFLKYRKWVKIEQDNNIGIKEYMFLDSNNQRIQTKKW